MFRDIRKKKNRIDEAAAKALLRTERRGVLAMYGMEDYPYAIPINYYYDEEKQRICFHSARAGHKADALAACDKVCFTVYGHEEAREEAWAPYMQSVVLFGRCRPITDQEEKLAALRLFGNKYYPDSTLVEEEISADGRAVQMYEILIEHLSGKEVQEK